jgi:hypothetical protein
VDECAKVLEREALREALSFTQAYGNEGLEAKMMRNGCRQEKNRGCPNERLARVMVVRAS